MTVIDRITEQWTRIDRLEIVILIGAHSILVRELQSEYQEFKANNICSKASLQSPVVALQSTYSEGGGGVARSWGGLGVSVMDV